MTPAFSLATMVALEVSHKRKQGQLRETDELSNEREDANSPNHPLSGDDSFRVLELLASSFETSSEVVGERSLGVVHPLRVDSNGPLADDLLLALDVSFELGKRFGRPRRRLGRERSLVPVGS